VYQNQKIHDNASPVLVATSTVEYAEASSGEHLRATHQKDAKNEAKLARIEAEMQAEMIRLLCIFGDPSLAADLEVLSSKLNYWKYARVVKPRKSPAGDENCMVVFSEPPLVCAGDYYFDPVASSESTVASAMASARAAVKHIVSDFASRTGGVPRKPFPLLVLPVHKAPHQCLPLPRPPQNSLLETAEEGVQESTAGRKAATVRAPPRVLIVGAGLTGSLVCHKLCQSFPVAPGITVWEMARGAGGRISTTRSKGGSNADMGALYLTSRAGGSSRPLMEELRAAGVVRGASAETLVDHADHFVSRDGINAVAKHLLRGAEVRYETPIRSLSLNRAHNSGGGGSGWVASSPTDTACFDAVVFALPPSAVHRIKGDAHSALREHGSLLKGNGVDWSSQFSLALWYPASCASAIRSLIQGMSPVAVQHPDVGSSAVIQVASLEGNKRNPSAGGDTLDKEEGDTRAASEAVLVIQSTESFFRRHRGVPAGGGKGGGRQKAGGRSHGRDVKGAGREHVVAELLVELDRLYPGLARYRHAEQKLISWRESRARPAHGAASQVLVGASTAPEL